MAKRIMVEPKHEKVAKALEREQAKGTPASQAAVRALKSAGYADKQARKGWNLINQTGGIQMAMRRRAAKILGLEKEIVEQMTGPQLWESLIEWRLQQNIMSGQDKAVQSAKLLGNHKKLGLWNAEIVVGVNLNALPEKQQRWLDELAAERERQDKEADTYEVRDPESGAMKVVAVKAGSPLPPGVLRRVTQDDDFEISEADGLMQMTATGHARLQALQDCKRGAQT